MWFVHLASAASFVRGVCDDAHEGLCCICTLRYSHLVGGYNVNNKTTGKTKQDCVELDPPTTLRPPLPLSISDQLLEELANEIQKWTPPTLGE